jgi:hypothetical protein
LNVSVAHTEPGRTDSSLEIESSKSFYEGMPQRGLPQKLDAVLLLSVNPDDAGTYVDGEYLGKGSVRIPNITPGKHSVSITCRRYESISDSIVVPEGMLVKKRFRLKRDIRFVVDISNSIVSGRGFNDNSDIYGFGPWITIGKVLRNHHEFAVTGGFSLLKDHVSEHSALYYGKYPSRDIFAGGGVQYSPILNLGGILLIRPEVYVGFWNAKQKVIAYNVEGEWMPSNDEFNSYLLGGIGLNCSVGYRRFFVTSNIRLFIGNGIYFLRSPLMGLTFCF